MRIFNNFFLISLIIFSSGCVGLRGVKTIESGFYTARWYINPNIEESKMLGSSTSDYGAAAEKKRDNYIIKYFDYQGKEIPQEDLKRVKSSRKFWRSYLTRTQYMENKKRDFERNLKEFIFVDDNMSDEKFKEAIDNGATLYQVSGTREEYIKAAQKNIKVDDWEDDPNQFYYIKDEHGKFVIESHISSPHLSYVVIPIKQCFGNGWCEVYPSRRDHQTTFYVKESALLDSAN